MPSEYRILLKSSVTNDVQRIDHAKLGQILKKTFKFLLTHPQNGKLLSGKHSGFYSYRIGDCRVIYAIQEKDIIIFRIGHRSTVYKKELSEE